MMHQVLTRDELTALHNRLELMTYLREMADTEVQKANWRGTSNPDGTEYGPAYFYDFVVEDRSFIEHSVELAEWLYLTEAQALAIEQLALGMAELVNRVGYTLDSDRYTRDNEWPSIVELAQVAYALMSGKQL
jgi:hypothetical protein